MHRDLKPQNVLCRSKQQAIPAKICDFNLAYNGNFDGDHSIFFSPVGTLDYMSPEMVLAQIAGEAAPNTPACDVWGVGVILYVILSGLHKDEGGGWQEGKGGCEGAW